MLHGEELFHVKQEKREKAKGMVPAYAWDKDKRHMMVRKNDGPRHDWKARSREKQVPNKVGHWPLSPCEASAVLPLQGQSLLCEPLFLGTGRIIPKALHSY